jgi:hypothetical protein
MTIFRCALMVREGGRQSRPETGFVNGRAGCQIEFDPLQGD